MQHTGDLAAGIPFFLADSEATVRFLLIPIYRISPRAFSGGASHTVPGKARAITPTKARLTGRSKKIKFRGSLKSSTQRRMCVASPAKFQSNYIIALLRGVTLVMVMVMRDKGFLCMTSFFR
jgi:hypothetical protein